MKSNLLLTLSLTFVITFSSCSDDDSSNSTPTSLAQNVGAEKFSGNFGGTSLNANQIRAYQVNGFMSIIGVIGNDSIVLTTTKPNVGNYTAASNGLNGFYYYKGSETYSTQFVDMPDGVISITSYDSSSKIVSGNFAGTIRDLKVGKNINVTDGKFENIHLIDTTSNLNLGSLSAKVDGQKFESYFCTYQPNFKNGGLDAISGSNIGVTKSITIQINETLKIGSYNLDGFNNSGQYFSDLSNSSDPNNFYSSDSGKLIVTSIDNNTKTVKGTFNFKATNASFTEVDITGGEFVASFQ